MPAACHDFNERFGSGGPVRRDSRRRSSQHSAKGSRPLGILMIKTLSMIMVGLRVNG